jgi:hypothetical protein
MDAETAVQVAELNRVESKIAPVVLEFFNQRSPGFEYHMGDLQQYVAARADISPDSPSRILRDLKRKGEINYEIVNRRQSLYRFLGFIDGRKERPLHEILRDMGLETLDEYYVTDGWVQRRERYFETHERRCRLTGRTDNIQLHHIRYTNLGNEPDADLMPLCAEAHEMLHLIVKEYGVPLEKAHLVFTAIRNFTLGA